jgi:hypothetical protein
MPNQEIHQQVLRAIRSQATRLPSIHPAKAYLRATVREALQLIAEGGGRQNLLPRARTRAQVRQRLGVGEL